MSERRANQADTRQFASGRPAPASSTSATSSSSSSTAKLAPFANLTGEQVAFISAIIARVPSSVTTFVLVYKAYQEEFESRGQSSTGEEFYYHLLLKLGMIRSDNWATKWKVVCDHYGYNFDASELERRRLEGIEEDDNHSDILHDDRTPRQKDIQQRGSVHRRQYHYSTDEESHDAFTLHSHAESADEAPLPPPSYKSKNPISSGPLNRIQRAIPEPSSTSTPPQSSRRLPTMRRLTTQIVQEESIQSSEAEEESVIPSPKAAVPPSYRTVPAPTARTVVADRRGVDSTTRDDAETWKVIQMERDADLFRREFLLSCCLDVWVKGLRWIRDTSEQLDHARNIFLLSSVLERWRNRSRKSMEGTRRAAIVDRVRILNGSLRKWRLKAWTERRKRWAEEMRGKMLAMQRRVEAAVLEKAWMQWKRAHTLNSAARLHDLALIQAAVAKWNRKLHHVSELEMHAHVMAQQSDYAVLERALATWKRRVHFRVVGRIVQEQIGARLLVHSLHKWRRKTQVYSVASTFSDARILREALGRWKRRRVRVQNLERRATAQRNKPLIRAVLRIWLMQSRLRLYERQWRQRSLMKTLLIWSRHLQANREREQRAVAYHTQKTSQVAIRRAFWLWARRIGERRRLERRAKRAYEATVKAKVLIQWRTTLWRRKRAVKDAKLVRQVLLTRWAWKRWRTVLESKRREEKRIATERNILRRAFLLWQEKAKHRRGLRRMGDVVRMAHENRILKEVLRAWTLHVVHIKDREYLVIQERREKLLRNALGKWRKKLRQQQENTSLMLSFQDVRREETLRKALGLWIHATRRKGFLAEREEEINRMLLSAFYDRWRDRFLENNLRPAELDVLLQSQTNLLFKMFRLWEARTPSIPAIRFHAFHTRAIAWKKWKAAMPGAMKRKEAKDFERRSLLGRALSHWQERYTSKISLKAQARARYLRLPPAPPGGKQASSTSRLLLIKPHGRASLTTNSGAAGSSNPRSYRSASPPDADKTTQPISRRAPTVSPSTPSAPTRGCPSSMHAPVGQTRAESSRAPSPTSTRGSFQGPFGLGLAGLARRKTLFGTVASTISGRAGSSVGGSQAGDERGGGPRSADADERSTARSSLDALRTRPRPSLNPGFARRPVRNDFVEDETD